MGFLSPDWSRIHQTDALGPWSLPLAVCAFPYGLGSRLRPLLYEQGFFKSRTLHGAVVSVGNLTVGGTGKTPAVVMLARWARDRGYRPAVLSRGYGGKAWDKVLEVSDGKRIKAGPLEAGDEPCLLAKRLPEVPLIVSEKRFHAGLFAREKFGSDLFILDDGFQHLGLKRDLDLVLMDASNPFGNGHLLPWGPLREPVSHLVRADAFIMTRTPDHDQTAIDFIEKRFSRTPVFWADHVPAKIVFPHSNDVRDPDFIKGKPVSAFAGIAHPKKFKDTLIRLGADIVHFKGFHDHHPFTQNDLKTLIEVKEQTGARYLLTTEKDWTRLSALNPMIPELAYLEIEFKLLSPHDGFFDLVEDRIQCRMRQLNLF